jgi:hypothetical protein
VSELRVTLPQQAADRLRLYEEMVRRAAEVRDTYGAGIRDGLDIRGAITGFDEVTGELIIDALIIEEPTPTD